MNGHFIVKASRSLAQFELLYVNVKPTCSDFGKKANSMLKMSRVIENQIAGNMMLLQKIGALEILCRDLCI